VNVRSRQIRSLRPPATKERQAHLHEILRKRRVRSRVCDDAPNFLTDERAAVP
jgi:hypothetical protein